MMKKIEAYIQPSKLDGLKNALIAAGITGMTVYPVRGFGRQHGYAEGETPGPEAKFLDKMKLEIVIEEEEVDQMVQIIINLAHTGTVGAGKVFVLPVEDAVRIGTNEVGTAALH